MKITYLCPAKINLFLEVNGKRPNGYHELTTLFAKIDWTDKLTLDVKPASTTHISLQITGPLGAHISSTPSNLVWKAAQAFLDHYELTANIHIVLEKHLPTGAGLGGGSSDAAGVLLILCQVFHKNPLDLIDLAARLGADVPLFLYPDTFLKGEGIGEKLTPVAASANLPYLVLVYPQVPVSTREVFARLKLSSHEEILTNLSKLDKLIDVVKNGSALRQWKPLLFNRLEEFVLPFVPAVNQALNELRQTNESICMMSGSGSTVFSLVGTKKDAQELAARLQPIKALVVPTAFYGGRIYANYGDQCPSNP